MQGSKYGQYELQSFLGGGGQGEVWLAHDSKMGRKVAVKKLKPEVIDDADVRRRFDVEAETLIQINEPYVVRVLDRIEIDGLPALVQDYMEGGSLADLRKSRKEPFEIEDILRWFEQAARGLVSIHKRGIVHRDIKPANLFLSRDGNLCIGDFGLIRSVEKTQTLGLMGTMPYMSPEQIRGAEIDARSDLFSLGVAMYELITGARPFGNGLDRIERLPSARKQRADVPTYVSDTIDALLEREVDGRIQSADDLLARLQGKGTGFRVPVPSARRLLAFAPILIAVVLGVAGGRCWIPGMPWCVGGGCSFDAPANVSERRIAFLPFEYRGDPGFARVAEEIPTLVAERLHHVADISTLTPEQTAACVAEAAFLTADTPEAAAWMYDRHLVLAVHGAVSELEGQFRIDLTFRYQGTRGYISDKETITLEAASDALAAVNDVGLEVLRQLLVGPRDDLPREAIRNVESLDAMLAFLQGFQSLRSGSVRAENLDQAVDLDSTMALAYYARGDVAGWSGEGADVELEYARKARRHADNLGTLGRSLIEANEKLALHDIDAAEAILLDLVSRHPDSPWAWRSLASIHYQHNSSRGRSWWECRREYETVLRLDEGQGVGIFLYFARIAEGDDQYIRHETADRTKSGAATVNAFTIGSRSMRDSLLAAVGDDWCGAGYGYHNIPILIYPDNHHNAIQFLEAHICAEDIPVRERPADLAWQALCLAHLNAGIGRWTEGRRWFDAVPPEFRAWGLVYEGLALSLPFVPASDQDLQRIIAELERWKPLGEPVMVDPEQLGALEDRFNPHMRVHEHLRQYCLAALHARTGDVAASRSAIEKLESTPAVPEVQQFVQDLAAIARARIAIQAEDWAGALAQLERVREVRYVAAGEYSSSFQRADARYLRAECLMELGQPEEALGWYDAADQAMEFLLIYTGMAHLRQAEANEQLGRDADAIEHYQIFLELFDEPDSFYADDVAQARERLAALEAAR